MGLYDSIRAKIECPRCKRDRMRLCQTKLFTKSMTKYDVGDIVELNECFREVITAKMLVVRSMATCYDCVIKKKGQCSDCGKPRVLEESLNFNVYFSLEDVHDGRARIGGVARIQNVFK